MLDANNKKRKATDQLSPYSQDLPENEHIPFEEAVSSTEPVQANFKKAKAKRANSASDLSGLKGIFGNANLTPDMNAAEKKQDSNYTKEEMISGLNKSLLKSIKMILGKQSNKDLRYIFEQYSKFLKDILDNNWENQIYKFYF